MEFGFRFPTDIHFGRGIVQRNSAALRLGARAFVVTGKRSGRASGALADVIAALTHEKIECSVFEGIGNNPDVEQCRAVGAQARAYHADFIIGIGGGSPLDAAKAVAVFAANDIPAEQLFTNSYENAVLPIVAVPTTSGTGSEATPWSVMTYHAVKTKRSFGSLQTYPHVALLDPTYTDNLPLAITRSTAMDAFTHCLESVISLKATPLTDALNFYALSHFKALMPQLEAGDVVSLRDALMLVSLLGGITISQTGTTLMHSIAYPFTYFHGTAHGLANAFALPVYLEEVAEHRPDRLAAALNALGMSQAELTAYVQRNYPIDFTPDRTMFPLWAEQTAAQGGARNTGTPLDPPHLEALYARIFA